MHWTTHHKMQSNKLILTLLGCLILATPDIGFCQEAKPKEKPKLVVRFLAVAKSPRLGKRNGKNYIIDEEAIPPGDLYIKKGGGTRKIRLMLNVPTANFMPSSRRMTVGRVAYDTERKEDEKAKPFIHVELPADTGVFTVVMTRRHGSKSWDKPIVKILKDPANQSTKSRVRVLNCSTSKILLASASKKINISPGKHVTLTLDTKKATKLNLFTLQKGKWKKMRPIIPFREKNALTTVICYPSRPKDPRPSTCTILQRNFNLTALIKQVKQDEKDSLTDKDPPLSP